MKTKPTSKGASSKSSSPSKIVPAKKLSSIEEENKSLHKRITELEKELTVVRNKVGSEQLKEAIAASEEKFRILIENIPIGIYYSNLKGDFLYGNRTAEEIIGYKREELIGKNFLKLNLLSFKDIPLAIKLLALNVSGKQTGPDQFELNRKDGKKVFVEIHTQIVTLGSQKIILGLVKNITERRRAEQLIKVSEERYRVLAESAHDIIFVINKDDRVQYVNTFAARLFSTTPEKIIGKLRTDLFPPEIAGEQGKSLKNVFESGQPQFNESSLRFGDREMWINTRLVPLCDETGVVTAVMGISRDITERKRAEEELEESREKYRGLSEAAFEAIFISEKGICIEQNQRAEKMFGYTSEEAIGRHGTEWIVPEDREKVMKNMLAGLEEPYEATALRKDGTTFPCLLHAKMTHYKGRNVRVTSLSDMTERKRAEEARFISEKRLKNVIENSPDTIYTLDLTTGKANMLNRINFLGYTKQELESSESILHTVYPDDLKLVMDNWKEMMAGTSAKPIEYRISKKDGDIVWLGQRITILTRNADNTPDQILVTLSDITERKRAEQALRISEERFRTVVNSTEDIIYTLDVEQRHTGIFGHWVEKSGLTPEYFLNKTARAIFGLNATVHEDANRRALAGEYVIYDWESSSETGTHYFQTSLSPLRDTNGNINGLVGLGREITERKRAEEKLRENEKRYRSIVENIRQAYYEADSRSLFTYCNTELAIISGYSEQELIGMSSLRFVAKEHRERIAEAYNRMKKEKQTDMTVEFMVQTKNGEKFWVEQTTHYEFDEQGRFVKAANILKNIHERKLAEEALRKSEEQYRQLYENVPIGIYRTTPDGRILASNPAITRMLGYSSFEDYSNRNLEQEPDAVYARNVFKEQLERDGSITGLETEWLKADKTPVFVRENARVIRDETGNVLYYDGTVEDITERKQIEQALQKSEIFFRSVWEHSTSAMRVTDANGIIVSVNRAFCTMAGKTEKELVGSNFSIIYDEKERSRIVQKHQDRFSTKTVPAFMEKEVLLWNGKKIWLEVLNSFIDFGESNLFLLGIFTDITERKKSEKQLLESEVSYRDLFNSVTDAIYIQDTDGRFIDVNVGVEKMYGYSREEIVGKFPDFLSAPDRNNMEEVARALKGVAAGEPQRFEFWGKRKNGEIFPKEVRLNKGIYLGKDVIIALAQDITERRNSEQLIRDLQKRESIGVLASGIAHDFNNLLTAVMGNVSLAKLRIPDDHPSVLNLDKTMTAAVRAATLTKQMLAYSGKGRFQTTTIDLVKVVQEHIGLFEASLPKNITLIPHFPSSPVIVKGDPGQIEQVVMNLVINGGEAIGDKQGVVNIEVSTRLLSDEELVPYGKLNNQVLQKGTYALFQVSDNGIGMNEDTITKIFDPFFTTKFVGRGLGLSAVLGILRSHGGGISVKSTEGVGTVFQVILPLVTSGIYLSKEKKQDVETIGHSPTVLVIDDEQYILDMLDEVFEERKYQRFLASDPEQGIMIYNTQWQTIDVVIVDYAMPKMNGTEVLIELRKINPNVKVIMSSGFSEEELNSLMGNVTLSAIIQKPYKPANLLSVMSKALQSQ